MQAKIVFVSILVLATFNLFPFSVYSKPLSLQVSDENKIGFEVLYNQMKCQRLFRPQFRKFNPSFAARIPQVSNTLTPNVGVSDDTPVR